MSHEMSGVTLYLWYDPMGKLGVQKLDFLLEFKIFVLKSRPVVSLGCEFIVNSKAPFGIHFEFVEFEVNYQLSHGTFALKL